MKLKVSAGFCAMACLLGWLSLPMCLWFLLGAAVHELGHLLALKLCGVPVHALRIGACGAVIETGPMNYGRELLCAAAGPLASSVLGLALLRVSPQGALLSFALAAVNLLPLYPLDGGRILRAALLSACARERAERIVHWVTVATCLGLMILACWGAVWLQAGVWPIFAALALLWRAGSQEKQLLFSAVEDKMKKQE